VAKEAVDGFLKHVDLLEEGLTKIVVSQENAFAYAIAMYIK
jgi:hypothetical protein